MSISVYGNRPMVQPNFASHQSTPKAFSSSYTGVPVKTSSFKKPLSLATAFLALVLPITAQVQSKKHPLSAKGGSAPISQQHKETPTPDNQGVLQVRAKTEQEAIRKLVESDAKKQGHLANLSRIVFSEAELENAMTWFDQHGNRDGKTTTEDVDFYKVEPLPESKLKATLIFIHDNIGNFFEQCRCPGDFPRYATLPQGPDGKPGISVFDLKAPWVYKSSKGIFKTGGQIEKQNASFYAFSLRKAIFPYYQAERDYQLKK